MKIKSNAGESLAKSVRDAEIIKQATKISKPNNQGEKINEEKKLAGVVLKNETTKKKDSSSGLVSRVRFKASKKNKAENKLLKVSFF